MPPVEVAARSERGVLALQQPPVFRFRLEGEDEFLRVVGDDQEDLARDLVDLQLLGERAPMADSGQREGRVTRGVLEPRCRCRTCRSSGSAAVGVRVDGLLGLGELVTTRR